MSKLDLANADFYIWLLPDGTLRVSRRGLPAFELSHRDSRLVAEILTEAERLTRA